MQFNLNQLRAFYLAAREKSMTKAAEVLFVTQPAVTMQIKGLLRALSIKEGPIFVQTVIAFPRNVELSLPAREFLHLAGVMK